MNIDYLNNNSILILVLQESTIYWAERCASAVSDGGGVY